MRIVHRVAPLLLLLACANPAEDEDAGPRDAGPIRDGGPAEDAGEGDAGVDRDGGPADAGDERDGGIITCTPNGRQYFMLGSAQNPQTITFGEGLPTERTLEIDGAYLAAFDSGGCFEWLALMPAQQGSFGGVNMIVDDASNIYFAIALNGLIEFRNADDSIALAITATAATPRETYRRGVAVVSYDRQGSLRWVRRIGNAAEDPTGKGYSVASLELTAGRLRIAGSANGATRGAMDDYDVVFGLGETNETRIAIGQRFQFGYAAALDPDSGNYIADSARITAPQIGATNFAARHNGRGTGREATDGSYALGLLFAGAAGNYVVSRGRADELGVNVTSNFVAGFTKYDDTGALAWTRLAGAASGGMAVFSSDTLADGSVLFSGGAGEQADFAQATGVVQLPVGASGYLVRYDNSGDVTWLRGFSGRGLSLVVVDEPRSAVFAVGTGDGDVTFGVDDADAVTETLSGIFVARFDLATGALVWLAPVDAASASFRDIDLIGDELLLSTRFDNNATFAPSTPAEFVINVGANIWSGTARFGVDDGTFRGVIEYVRQRGTPLNDGLNVGGIYQP